MVHSGEPECSGRWPNRLTPFFFDGWLRPSPAHPFSLIRCYRLRCARHLPGNRADPHNGTQARITPPWAIRTSRMARHRHPAQAVPSGPRKVRAPDKRAAPFPALPRRSIFRDTRRNSPGCGKSHSLSFALQPPPALPLTSPVPATIVISCCSESRRLAKAMQPPLSCNGRCRM